MSKNGSEFSIPAMMLSALISANSGEGAFIDVSAILRVPLLQPFLQRYKNALKAKDFSLLGTLGTEMIMVLYLAIEEQIRLKSLTLPHAIHFYKDGSSDGRTMDTPQVTWSGALLFSDEALMRFDDDELELLMTHEAMHLMKPNFFMVLSAADLTQRAHFPDLNTERAGTFMNNLLGRQSPGRPVNCPLELTEDDVLFTDYFVFYAYKDTPEKQRAYRDLLKRIHREFNPGEYSQTAFRVRFADTLLEHFEKNGSNDHSVEVSDAQFWRAVWSTAVTNYEDYLGGKAVTLQDFLLEMEKFPATKLDSKLIRIMLEYYKRKALLKEGWGGKGSNSFMTCGQIGQMLQTHQTDQ